VCHSRVRAGGIALPAVVPRAVTGWRLPAFVLAGGLLVGGFSIFFGGVSARPSAAAPDLIPAQVVDSAPCVSPDARDVVQIVVDGRPERLALDGCGYPVGTELQVELSRDELLARLAGTGETTGPLTERISMLLLVLAGVAGAIQTLILAPRDG
jgi:hypothetical protein